MVSNMYQEGKRKFTPLIMTFFGKNIEGSEPNPNITWGNRKLRLEKTLESPLTTKRSNQSILTTIKSKSVSFSCCSVAKSYLTLCDPMDCSMQGFPVFQNLPESSLFFRIFPVLQNLPCSNLCPLSLWCYLTISSSVILFSSCPQSFPHQGLSHWVSTLHQVAILECQL